MMLEVWWVNERKELSDKGRKKIMNKVIRVSVRKCLRGMKKENWYWIKGNLIKRKEMEWGMFNVKKVKSVNSGKKVRLEGRKDIMWKLIRWKVWIKMRWMRRDIKRRKEEDGVKEK